MCKKRTNNIKTASAKEIATFRSLRETSPFAKHGKYGWYWILSRENESWLPCEVAYCGCGTGWLEIDDTGTPRKLRYAQSLSDAGSTSQNLELSAFNNKELCLTYLGAELRFRFRVNFSCRSCCQF